MNRIIQRLKVLRGSDEVGKMQMRNEVIKLQKYIIYVQIKKKCDESL